MNLVAGNEQILSFLINSVREKKVAGCYLIEGAEGTGKLSVARYVASALLCSNTSEEKTPCGSCHHCTSIAAGSHVDVFELYPEEGKLISVSKIREMLQFTHMLPSLGDWRVFIVSQAEMMNAAAQNALLKSIEEPREHTVFFLLTKDQTKLLPTVRSRAVKLHTETMDGERVRQILLSEGADPKKLEDAVLLCGGSLGKARDLLKNTEFSRAREKVLSYFKALMDGAGFTRLSLIFPPKNVNRKELANLLPMIKLGLRDLMCFRSDSHIKPAFFTDPVFLRDLASIISPVAANQLFQLALELEQALAQNVNIFSALSGFHLTAQKLTKGNN